MYTKGKYNIGCLSTGMKNYKEKREETKPSGCIELKEKHCKYTVWTIKRTSAHIVCPNIQVCAFGSTKWGKRTR